jgi:hypothetical protein
MAYCGCGTAANKKRWVAFVVLVLIALGFAAATAVMNWRCREDVKGKLVHTGMLPLHTILCERASSNVQTPTLDIALSCWRALQRACAMGATQSALSGLSSAVATVVRHACRERRPGAMYDAFYLESSRCCLWQVDGAVTSMRRCARRAVFTGQCAKAACNQSLSSCSCWLTLS